MTPAHLRSLERCARCGRPATQRLHNAVNAPMGAYCDRHAMLALDHHNREVEAVKERERLRGEP